MLDYLFHSGRWPIALDLGTDSIKMLEMRYRGRRGVGVRLARCACRPTRPVRGSSGGSS